MFASRDLTFAYPGSAPCVFPDCVLAAGERVLVLGPSGSGKSTLLGLWAGLLTPRGGSVTLDGVRADRLGRRARDRWRGRNVGLVFQRPRMLTSQRISSNVQLPRRLAGLPAYTTDQLDAALGSLGLRHLAGRYPRACSVGELQRIGILRALATGANLILADEPTSALDRANARDVAELLIERTRDTNAALAVVTHDDRLAPLFPRTLELTTSQ